MVNTRHLLQNPKQVLTPVDEEHPHKNRRSAIDYYGKDYMDKLLKVNKPYKIRREGSFVSGFK